MQLKTVKRGTRILNAANILFLLVWGFAMGSSVGKLAFLGLLLSTLGIVLLSFQLRCPHCGKRIKLFGSVCPHCQQEVDP